MWWNGKHPIAIPNLAPFAKSLDTRSLKNYEHGLPKEEYKDSCGLYGNIEIKTFLPL